MARFLLSSLEQSCREREDVERLDIVKMVRLYGPPDFDEMHLGERGRMIADVVLTPFVRQRVLPEIARAIGRPRLFAGLDDDRTLYLLLEVLLRQRPDIGVVILRNLVAGLGETLAPSGSSVQSIPIG